MKFRTALLLSALVLPGLGHIYLGKRNKGIALVMLVNLLLLFSLFFFFKVASPLIAARLTDQKITTDLILTAIEPYSGWGKLLLVTFFALWGFGLMDLVKGEKDGKTGGDN